MSYQCPLCFNVLNLNQGSWRCANGHLFDLAKEGYVNLLPVQHKHSKTPGDSPEMMQARRAFLDAGFYQRLRDALLLLLAKYLPDDATALLDIGCGEGYYTAEIARYLQQLRGVTTYGLDIAKVAVRYAAKRYPQANFCVATSHRLPFADASLAAVLRIYAPCKATELQRVLKIGGIVITVVPAPRHLLQLKKRIYAQVQLHSDRVEQIDGFTLIEEQRLAYMMELNGEQVQNLLQMTPFAWRASTTVKQQLIRLNNFKCETDFLIRVFVKSSEEIDNTSEQCDRQPVEGAT